jgi:hypothetical protein
MVVYYVDIGSAGVYSIATGGSGDIKSTRDSSLGTGYLGYHIAGPARMRHERKHGPMA